MEIEQRHRILYGLAILWLVFTVSLASWWMIFGLRQAEKLRQLDETRSGEIAAAHRMLLGEGAVLIASLVAGGAALLYGIHRERERHRAIEDFFAAFTHELRTSLASLRLQVESLQEDFEERGDHNPLLDRLMKDSVRLQLQLDNSLFYANRRKGNLYIERLSLSRVVDSIAPEFTDLSIRVEDDPIILADARALESVFRNLFQNALVHGHADTVVIRSEPMSGPNVRITVEDNGKGPSTDPEELGKLFFRPTSKSGTGVGLYISRQLLARMKGSLALSRGDTGLLAILELPEARS
ncbi:MAG: HAMP domain-containing sensor histidine kinase [Thermoanaerobaculia bacterium]|nr:HAMP domain-containing sensor histidine kinase [Thermoanaerobaculia bacterium]